MAEDGLVFSPTRHSENGKNVIWLAANHMLLAGVMLYFFFFLTEVRFIEHKINYFK